MAITAHIVHRGLHPHLGLAACQARAISADVVVLGDRENRNIHGAEHVDMQRFSRSARYFEAVYQHRAFNDFPYELFCLQRWCILDEFLRREGARGPFAAIDSDVLLFENPGSAFERLGSGWDLALPRLHMPSVTLWRSLEVLSQFVDTMFRCYEEPGKLDEVEARFWSEERKRAGKAGISDMIMFDVFREETECPVLDLANIRDGAVYDPNTMDARCAREDLQVTPDREKAGFEFLPIGRKWIGMRDGKPYGRLAATGEEVEFKSLHFQGHGKPIMAEFTTLRAVDHARIWIALRQGAIRQLRKRAIGKLSRTIRQRAGKPVTKQ